MVSMKLPKKDKKDAEVDSPIGYSSSPADRDAYPYGLKLRFENEQVKQLDDEDMLPADIDDANEVVLTVRGYISDYDKDRMQDGSTKVCIGIQITDIDEIKIDDSKDKEEEAKSRTGSLLSPTR